jgi:hypothetical protein
MKISLVGIVLFRGEERTDIRDEAVVYKEPAKS